MDIHTLNQTVQAAIGRQVFVEQEGTNRYLVMTPFAMEDGDHYTIVLRGEPGQTQWTLTDEGDTLMHLGYWMDYDLLKKGTRQEIITRVLNQYGIENRQGELRMAITADQISSALFTFLQALTRVTDVTYLSRETVRSTFMDDFREFMRKTVPADRLTFDYAHTEFDRKKVYTVDALVNHRAIPLYVFAIGSDTRCRDVTINLLNYRSWGVRFQSLAIFEDQEEIGRSVLARFSDTADKQFSSLLSSKPAIKAYLDEQLTMR
jgi:hypothetical protein